MPLLALLIALLPAAALGQADYPSRPVRLVVPFPPGGATDVVARLLAGKLSDGLQQQIVVENRPGAGATLGTEQVARSAPDGYTLLMTAFPSITTAPLVNPNVRYDAIEDFTHLVLLGTFPNGLVVRADSEFRSLADLIAHAKANPGKVTYGSAGPASSGHVTGLLLAREAGIEIVHVPYKGAAPAFLDLLAGEITADFDGMINASRQAQAGKVRLIAVTSERRLGTHPALPTLAETVPGVFGESWFGVAGPAKLPAAISQRLETGIARAMAQPEVRMRLGETGMTLSGLRGAGVVQFIRDDIRKWSAIAARMRDPK
jgi:tripartite-type tricarboxylate transporter receptor subunit TctC